MECRFCHKQITRTNEYYSHLYIHINKDTISSMTAEEIELCKLYHTRRIEIRQKSYYKNKDENCKYECEICKSKYKYITPYKSHLFSIHTKEELCEAGYDEAFIAELEKTYNKRRQYQVENDAEHKTSKRQRQNISELLSVDITAQFPSRLPKQHFQRNPIPIPIANNYRQQMVQPVLLAPPIQTSLLQKATEESVETDDEFPVEVEYYENGLIN